jgi:hypothetical protein
MRTLLCLFLAGGLAAQASVVFPSNHATITNGSTSIDWSPLSSGISRQQIVYDAWDLGIPANTSITRIGFRQEPGASSVARQVQMDVRMNITTATSSTLSATYDNNFNGAPTTVFAQGLFTLPAFTSTQSNVVYINLTTPFLYTGGNLLVDFRIYANNNGNQAFSYYLDRATFVSPVLNGVSGCPHSGGPAPVLTTYPTAVGATWQQNLASAPASAPGVMLITVGAPLATPYSLQALGLQASCQGQVPAGFAAFGIATGISGTNYTGIPLPNSLGLNNLVATSQVAIFDLFSPGSLVVSNAVQVTFGANPAATILWSQGSATATAGSVYANYCPVTFFN